MKCVHLDTHRSQLLRPWWWCPYIMCVVMTFIMGLHV